MSEIPLIHGKTPMQWIYECASQYYTAPLVETMITNAGFECTVTLDLASVNVKHSAQATGRSKQVAKQLAAVALINTMKSAGHTPIPPVVNTSVNIGHEQAGGTVQRVNNAGAASGAVTDENKPTNEYTMTLTEYDRVVDVNATAKLNFEVGQCDYAVLFKDICEEGPSHMKRFKVGCEVIINEGEVLKSEAVAKTKKDAKRLASAIMLNKFTSYMTTIRRFELPSTSTSTSVDEAGGSGSAASAVYIETYPVANKPLLTFVDDNDDGGMSEFLKTKNVVELQSYIVEHGGSTALLDGFIAKSNNGSVRFSEYPVKEGPLSDPDSLPSCTCAIRFGDKRKGFIGNGPTMVEARADCAYEALVCIRHMSCEHEDWVSKFEESIPFPLPLALQEGKLRGRALPRRR